MENHLFYPSLSSGTRKKRPDLIKQMCSITSGVFSRINETSLPEKISC